MQKLTNSARNKFAACHRAYQLFYVQGYVLAHNEARQLIARLDK